MSNKLFIDANTNGALAFGRQSTSSDANTTQFNWNSFLKKGFYLNLDSTGDANLINAIDSLGWSSDVIE